jgi:hypothetical protein
LSAQPRTESQPCFGRAGAVVGGGIGDALMHLGHLAGVAARISNGKVTLLCKKGEELGLLGFTPPITYSPPLTPVTAPPGRRDEEMPGIGVDDVFGRCAELLERPADASRPQ